MHALGWDCEGSAHFDCSSFDLYSNHYILGYRELKIQFDNIFTLQRNIVMSLTLFAHSLTKFLSDRGKQLCTSGMLNTGELHIPSGFIV